MLRLLFVALFAVALARHRVKRSAKEEIENGVNSAITQWISGDDAALQDVYTEDAKLITGKGKVYQGRDAIKAYATSVVQGLVAGKFEANKVIAEGDMAATIGVVTVTTKKDEVETEMKLRWLGIFKKVDGKYRVVVEGVFDGTGEEANRRRRRETVQEQIRAKHDEFLLAVSENKLQEAFQNIYLEDAVYIKPCGGIVEGRAAIAAHMAEKGKELKDPSTTILEVIDSEDLAVEIGLTKFTTEHDGEPMKHSMRHVAVWKKTDDGLRVAYDAIFGGDGEHVHPMRHEH